MYVATLLANPKAANLTPEIVQDARSALSGTVVHWLCNDTACEFELPTMPELWEPVWDHLQKQQIDLAIQPAEGRRKSVLLADMDCTMIEQECIDELAAAAGVGERVAHITVRAMNGEMDFEDAVIERVGLLAGVPVSVVADVLATRITLTSGGKDLLATMKANGAYCALVSGGFVDFTSAIAAQLGFDEHRANTLLRDGDRLTGKAAKPILGREAKIEALNEIIQRLNLTAQDVMAVGDGANDLGMLHLAGSGVALHAKPMVAAECDLRLNHADLTGLLYLQGYKQSEFADVPA